MQEMSFSKFTNASTFKQISKVLEQILSFLLA